MIGRRAFCISALAGASLLSLAGCDAGPMIEFHYRLTVEVETPAGLQSGYSVIKFWGRKASSSRLNLSPGALGARFAGEAAVVELPNGQALFALLKAENEADAANYPLVAFEDDIGGEQDVTKRLRLLQSLMGQSRPLSPDDKAISSSRTLKPTFPMLVTFKDITDPSSVERVDPDDLAASFGAGYKLKSVSVMIAEGPMTSRVKKSLPWWKIYLDRNLDGSPAAVEDVKIDNLAGSLSARSFSTELTR
jgi:hypothetical protein